MNNESYYYHNEKYSDYLNKQTKEAFQKISNIIIKYSHKLDHILDVGCGSGNLLQLLKNRKNKIGIDVSRISVENGKLKNLNCLVYNGKKIPFADKKFKVVSSLNVLEHVDDVELFLAENLRVLNKNGYLIITCPNFLSITNNFHWHTAGLRQKISNFFVLLKKIFFESYKFAKMKTIIREDFHPDDDACNVTNPIDILKWAKKKKLKLKYWSSQPLDRSNKMLDFIDGTFFKVFFGSSIFVFKK